MFLTNQGLKRNFERKLILVGVNTFLTSGDQFVMGMISIKLCFSYFFFVCVCINYLMNVLILVCLYYFFDMKKTLVC